MVLTPLVFNLADLLRDKTHHEYQNGCGKKQCAHICKTAIGYEGIAVVEQSDEKHEETDREEHSKRRVQGTKLGNGHKESHAIPENRYTTFSCFPFFDVNRDVFDTSTISQHS